MSPSGQCGADLPDGRVEDTAIVQGLNHPFSLDGDHAERI